MSSPSGPVKVVGETSALPPRVPKSMPAPAKARPRCGPRGGRSSVLVSGPAVHEPAKVDSRDLAALREDYLGQPLRERDMPSDPFVLARQWLQAAVRADVKDPNAMTLATVDRSGAPDGRVVLLKGLEGGRLVFYTNYESAKGRQLDAEPRVALVMFWNELERQIRFRGEAARVDESVSRAYFQSRPRASQLGAWASAQSETIPSRETLEARYSDLAARYPPGSEIPAPAHWGGYAVRPSQVEFWQGRSGRLHDRLRADLEDSEWRWRRLSP